jgi:hypothetical protein
MIRLSDVKVRQQYRIRVRQRLMTLDYARLHGSPAASRRFGGPTRTIRRWRGLWRAGGLEGLVPRYPRLALQGRTPAEKLAALVGPPAVVTQCLSPAQAG